MRTIGTLVLLLCVTLVLAACGADGRYGVTVVTEGAHSIATGETLHGDVVITGGQLAVQFGGRVTGALHILGGAADVDGAVGGNMAILSGALRLGPAARVGGDLLALAVAPAGLGAVVLTHFGTQVFVPDSVLRPAPTLLR